MKRIVSNEGFVIPHITKVGEIIDNEEKYSFIGEEMKKFSFIIWLQGPSCHRIDDDDKRFLETTRNTLMSDIINYYGGPLDV
jgi:hypothetical protein